MLLAAFLLLLSGVTLAFMMAIKVLPPSFFLVFLSYLSSTFGLILGFVGIAQFIRTRK